jgi:ABC-type transporter Mla maintaining outer membrane lipid asymmetry ATPase subunit MlaF
MNATLVVVTHDILRAYQFAGRIVFVVDQTVLDAGGGEAIRHHPDPRVQQFIHGDLIGPLTQGREL